MTNVSRTDPGTPMVFSPAMPVDPMQMAALQGSVGNRVIARLLAQREPQAPAAPAQGPQGSALATLAAALLTPGKTQRQGDAILSRGYRFTAEPTQVGQELTNVYEHTRYGAKTREASLDDFVDDVAARLDTPASIEDLRSESLKTSGPTTEQLCKDVKSALESGRKYVHTVHAQFLAEFQQHATKVFDTTLDKSRDQITAERDRYGVKHEETTFLGIKLSESNTMASNADSKAMLEAVGDMYRKYTYWAMAKGLNSGGLSLYAGDAEGKAKEFATAYNAARAVAEPKYPVIAAFNLDLSRGAELDGQFKRLLDSPAALIAPMIAEKLENISVTRTAVWGKLSRLWGFPGIVSLTRSEMGLEPDSHMDQAVSDRITEEKEDYEKKQLAIGAVVLALTALSPVTGGASGVLAAGIGAAMTADSIREAVLLQAESGTAFQKAQAISKDEPNWYWVAAEIVATIVDLKGAMAEFKVLVALKRDVMAAKAAAQASKDMAAFEESVGKLKQRGNSQKPGLGDQMEQEVRLKSPADDAPPSTTRDAGPPTTRDGAPPSMGDTPPPTLNDPNVLGAKPGFGLTFTDEVRAHAVYNDWIKVRPGEEVALIHSPKTGEWSVVHGTADEVKLPGNMFTDQAGNPWTIMKHYHPGSKAIMRVPSIEDFKALADRNPGKAWESIVEYIHPVTGKKRYTYFGYDPAAHSEGAYWVKYMTPAESGPGTIATKRFSLGPQSHGGKDEYQAFVAGVEAKNREVMQGAATGR